MSFHMINQLNGKKKHKIDGPNHPNDKRKRLTLAHQ